MLALSTLLPFLYMYILYIVYCIFSILQFRFFLSSYFFIISASTLTNDSLLIILSRLPYNNSQPSTNEIIRVVILSVTFRGGSFDEREKMTASIIISLAR